MQWVANAVQKNNKNPILDAQINVTYSIIKKVQSILQLRVQIFGLKALQKILSSYSGAVK